MIPQLTIIHKQSQTPYCSLHLLKCEPNHAISVLVTFNCSQRDEHQSLTSDMQSASRHSDVLA